MSTFSEARFKPDLRSTNLVRFRKGAATSWLRVVTLLGFDSLSIIAAWRIAEHLRTPVPPIWNTSHNLISLLPIVAIEIGIIAARGLYKAGDPRRDYLGLIKAVTLSEIVLLLAAFFYQPHQLVSRSHFLLFWVANLVLTCSGRFLVDATTELMRTNGAVRYSAFLIADDEYRDEITRIIDRENRYNIVGITDAESLDQSHREATIAKIQLLGVAEVFVEWSAIQNRLYLSWHFQTAGITLHVLPVGLDRFFQGSKSWLVGGSPALKFLPPVLTGVDFWVKRIFDLCSAILILILASPLYAAIALAIKLDSPGSIFYRQTRIGLHGKPIKVWKFRTMVENADQLQKQLEALNEMKDGVLFKMKDDPRVTRVGRFLRQYSLDELPQIFNVIVGEMSLVGPRPLPLRDVEKFARRHYIRHDVLPGITGLWQVSGRSNIVDFEDVVKLDITYIENWSLWLDLKILMQTVNVVLRKTGAY